MGTIERSRTIFFHTESPWAADLPFAYLKDTSMFETLGHSHQSGTFSIAVNDHSKQKLLIRIL